MNIMPPTNNTVDFTTRAGTRVTFEKTGARAAKRAGATKAVPKAAAPKTAKSGGSGRKKK